MLGAWVVAGALAVAVAACSGGDDEATPPPAPSAEDRADRSTPFLVGAPPGGLEAVAIGTGQLTQAWDDDSVGDDEPSTVLAPDGDPTHQDAIVVSTSGYGGYQGGLDQASPGYLQGSLEPTELDGDDARWWPGGEVDGVHLDPALAVARGDIALTDVGPVDRSVLEVDGHAVPALVGIDLGGIGIGDRAPAVDHGAPGLDDLADLVLAHRAFPS